ncbi:alpha/beta fold hydrolase [Priestia koreensis]|uniref:alpha/beta fold hydrolase n=1 Tax=Priestia koreensis TaxID=284581 RepID=UPI001F59F737|nr:alpha/beta fold hydrolase [Priestia koreensis]UNL86801.1 alpha/beta hydrolase [Priestia koreensis]
MPKVQANGIFINYEVRGEGEPLLLLHGLGASWKMWVPQIDYLSRYFKLIMIDMRGHGQTSKYFPNNKYNTLLLAEDIKFFLDALGIKKVNMLGVSQGAVVAQLFAIKNSSYIKKLILSNSYSEIPTKLSKWVLGASNLVIQALPYNTVVELMLKVYKNDEYTKKILRNSFSFDKKMLLSAKKSTFPTHTSELTHISCSTLVMGGNQKVMGVDEKKASQIIFNQIPNATLALFSDAFDPLSTMKKDIFNEMVMCFITDNDFKSYPNVQFFYH